MKVSVVDLAKAFARDLSSMSPVHAAGVLHAGFLAHTIGRISDEHWGAMLETAGMPCGEPECDCHKLRTKVMTALDELRTDFLEQTAQLP